MSKDTEREELVAKLVIWFDEQAHSELDSPVADLDWRQCAEQLADFIISDRKTQKARVLEVVRSVFTEIETTGPSFASSQAKKQYEGIKDLILDKLAELEGGE